MRRSSATSFATLALGVVVVLLALTGCVVAGQSDTADPVASSAPATPSSLKTSAPDSSQDQNSQGCPVGQQQNSSGSCAPCADFEGCFDYPSNMHYFFDRVVELIQQYSGETFQDLPDPTWSYVPEGDTGSEGCTDAEGNQAAYSDHSYEYCPLDKTVYVGELQMWDYYSRLGDAAPAVGMAHEWGHHLQAEAGITTSTPDETIVTENQADCVAGAWSKWLVEKNIMNDDDFDDIGALLVEIGSAEGPGRDHGTAEEREGSFVHGFQGGMKACNEFVPDKPLIR